MKKVIPGKIKTQLRLDGYYNVLNKYGTQHDSTEYYQWASGSAVSDTELADLYAGNGLFSTIIDAPADDATKNGIDLGIKDKDLQKQLDNHLQTIRYQSKFAKALRWARLFGGAAVVMLVDDGRLLQDPLNWRDVHGVEEGGTSWECTTALCKLGADYAEETVESITAAADDWWVYAEAWTTADEAAPSLEERVSVLETLFMGGEL